MRKYSYVVIGGGIAGARAVENIRKTDPDGSILLLTDEPFSPYQRPPLSKGYLRGDEGLDAVILKDDEFYDSENIEVRTNTVVTSIDRQARVIRSEGGADARYGKLLLATGAYSHSLDLVGADLAGVMTLRTIEDADTIRHEALDAQHVVVIGGSFTGSEAAASLRQAGANVVIAFPEPYMQARLVTEDLGAYLQELYESKGITVLPETTVSAILGEERVEGVELSDGRTLPAEMLLLGVGAGLNTALARQAGLEMDDNGGIKVNDRLRTSDPNIYAAGDIASWPTADGSRLRLEHWDTARTQGIRAGRNMAGEDKPYRAIPYFFSDVFDLYMEAWGDFSRWDSTVCRGTPGEGPFAYFYFRDGVLVAALHNHATKDEQKAAPKLVTAGLKEADVAKKLQDPAVALADLIA